MIASVAPKHAERSQDEIKSSTLEKYDDRWGHFLWFGEGSTLPGRDLPEFLRTVASDGNP